MRDELRRLERSQEPLSDKAVQLNDELKRLQGKLTELDVATETYQREFEDRQETGMISGSSWLERRGVSTFQDWVFAAFFVTYALVVIILFIYAALYSTKKAFALPAILITGVLGGMLIASVLIRFG